MLTMAVQLLEVSHFPPVCTSFSGCELKMSVSMQTLCQMHIDAELCHLDVTPRNVMLEAHSSDPWDTLRLIDFAFSRRFNTGRHTDSDLGLTA